MTGHCSNGFDPSTVLATRWPEVRVVVEPMPGRLLGVLHYPLIVLRAGTSAAQRRSTLTHELVHLERGVPGCGAGPHEERRVEAEAARLLIDLDLLARALREAGSRPTASALAALLDVDSQLVATRLDGLSHAERAALLAHGADELWRVA